MWSPSSCVSEVWFCRWCEGLMALPIPSTWGQPAPLPFSTPMIWGACCFCETEKVFCCVHFLSFGAHSSHTSLIHFVLQMNTLGASTVPSPRCEVPPEQATRFWRQVLIIPTIKPARLSITTYSERILKFIGISRDNVSKFKNFAVLQGQDYFKLLKMWFNFSRKVA